MSRSPPAKVSGRRDSSPGAGQAGSWLYYRTPGLTRFQLKLQEMEEASAYLGHHRTFISQERTEVALSTLLTIQVTYTHLHAHTHTTQAVA